jgi:hypothetical protein
MERTTKERNLLKIFNRTFSFAVLFFAIAAVCYSTKTIIDLVATTKENKRLQENLTSLKEANDRLGITNQKLKDKDYFNVYVEDNYQYSSNDNTITPIN